MARDILCIPASEALVERVFSTARDVCNYRRNRMGPDTIRSIMLVYYRQKIEQEQLFEHYSVTDIINSTTMTEEEIAFEYNAIVDTIQEKMAIQYIPDRSPNMPNTHNRTTRNEERYEFIQSRRGLHGLQRVQQTPGQRQSQVNTSTLTSINLELDDDLDGLPPTQNNGDYLLPLLSKPSPTKKLQNHQRGVVQSVESSQVVRNKSRSGREILETWRNTDI